MPQPLFSQSVNIVRDADRALSYYHKLVANIQTDLDKLMYIMKTLHTVSQPTQYPTFWDEEWLRRAIDELNTRNITPEERFQFARIIAINAEAVNADKLKIEEAKELGKLEAKTEATQKQLRRGKLTINEIAEDQDVSVDFVMAIQQQLTQY